MKKEAAKKFLAITLTLLVLIIASIFAIKLISNQNTNPNPNQNQTSSTFAISIIDGDTFETSEGETIRLLCVDTPETDEEGYEDASAYLSALILGKDVLIQKEGIDKYNRSLAWVYSEEILVNKEIVDNGFGNLFEYNGTNCSRMLG